MMFCDCPNCRFARTVAVLMLAAVAALELMRRAGAFGSGGGQPPMEAPKPHVVIVLREMASDDDTIGKVDIVVGDRVVASAETPPESATSPTVE